MKKLQEQGITLKDLLDRSFSLPQNFSVYYNPDNILSMVLLDGDKYVDENGRPIRVRRCSSGDFIKIVEAKINKSNIIQQTLF